MKIYLLPYSGGSSLYYMKWRDEDINFIPIEYKGHGTRIGEGVYKDIQDAAQEIAGLIERENGGEEYAILGHSLGGIITYEVYRQLVNDGFKQPKQLFISACRAPHCKSKLSVSDLSPEEYKKTVMDLGGMTEEFFNNKRIFNTFNPILYHDFLMNEKYNSGSITKIDCGVTVFAGKEDISINEDELQAWKQYSDCKIFKYSGNHFFIDEYRENIISRIKDTVFF